jgi:hypothetical protein
MTVVATEIDRRRLLLPLPLALADIIGLAGDLVARLGVTPLLTRDQSELLRIDNVVDADADGFADLGIEPSSLEAVVPSYLCRYRRGGKK